MKKCFIFIIFICFELIFQKFVLTMDMNPDPKFSEPITNITVPVGRDAILTCKVHDLISYKVAWLRVDTQTILTIQNHVITKNYRIGISHTEHRIWQLKIRDVRESDRGWYMCQINTDPMKSQLGYLDVVVPPDILDYETSHDMIIEEGQNATITCTATGLPSPTIIWKREKDKLIQIYGNINEYSFTNNNNNNSNKKGIYSYEGKNLTLYFVNRYHMGAYLCIATNGVPPTVSKRILLIVNFAPTIYTQYENIYAIIGQKIILECITESYPSSINYWLRDKEFIQGAIYESITSENIFKIVMRLTIRPIKLKDFGEYKCIAKNSIGETSKSIIVHQLSKKDTAKIHLQNITSDNYTTSLSQTELSFESSLSSSSSSLFLLNNPLNYIKLIIQNNFLLFIAIKFLILFYLS